MKMSKRIKEARKAKGLGQKELAEKLNVSWNFVSLMERGLSKVPIDRLKLLIKILGMNEERIVFYLVKEYEEKIREALK